MTTELILRHGSTVIGILLVAPIAAFLASMLVEARPGRRWRTRAP